MTREEAIRRIKAWNLDSDDREVLAVVIPELKESEDERMLREIKRYIKEQGDKPTGLPNGTVAVSDMIAWLEKQGVCDIDYPQKYQDNSQLNGCIVLEDFNGGEGMVRTWNKELKASDENIIKACIGMCLTDANEQRFKDYGTNLKDCLAWLEKQKVIDTDLLRKEIEKRMRNCDVVFERDYETYDPDTYYQAKAVAYQEILSFIDSLQQEQQEVDGLEKQKEQKPVDYEAELKKCKDNPLYFYDKYVSIKQKSEWSEEDIKKIRSEEYTKGFNDAAFGGKLKEWSVEDEDRIRQIERIAQQAGCTQKLQEEIHDWLKSLRPRWKPNKEQMKWLKDVIETVPMTCRQQVPLESLYNDLKKLM